MDQKDKNDQTINNPEVTEDIFADLDQRKEDVSQTETEDLGRRKNQWWQKRNLIFLTGFISLLVIGIIVYALWPRSEKVTEQESLEVLNQVVPINEQDTTNQNNNNVSSGQIDSDSDGLADTEEADLGTNAKNIDSDNDLLSDRLEVRVYQTDPNDSDTDHDGYSDGDEVRNFYNPNGKGKLLDVKNSIDDFNSKNKNQ
ncbi:MAG: hypothetical protein A2233_05390 [Candidatus Kerfeldbacteria bacterium RIFOXYA2_FULL_38_24]|uniref:Uncharacterized protein n=1 Tax=Candidatus Kerfeldbacteria bacterium RIFOXYB2_FULL_38_14 TaxID=1798547 RepID=A0A1G2BGJ4_9BACT|nr:MAG: hypothetical protein A2233_05390 [Candidatus Kerfeldbacteria bacterium RIFOXYA2_FULL_38_24]OGY88262.1 MAG: hypothetical protein A2319_03685 [Candidatus Kerfeldbacteria bacterium RIFOXYB2_FULL_38_14]OGY89385.1 MAG: hypothetical protein A2458_04205 [Candidatus Kerfeldbacteria bacterium RIFOXYC2_FULL_38_9]